MQNELIWIALCGAILFCFSGIVTLWAQASRKVTISKISLLSLTFLGPLTLGFCWKAQLEMMAEETILWARLMAGDASTIWAIGSLGLIAGTGLALGALSLQDKAKGILFGAIAFSLIWIVVYLHPTPHYVPLTPWQDKLIWLGLIVGGAIISLIIYLKFQSYLTIFQVPMVLIAGVVPLLSLGYPYAIFQVNQSIPLSQYSPEEQIKQLGCLSCHTMNGMGFSDPGEGLESVASRKEDALRAFLAEPTAENAKRFGIRENPTGEMAGVHLNESEVNSITEALKTLFKVQPPSKLGPGWDQVEAILTEKTCLACHSFHGEGAIDGGIGGALENAAKLDTDTLVEWLKDPSAENAVKLKIRETPIGAMVSFSLSDDQAKEVARWIQSIGKTE